MNLKRNRVTKLTSILIFFSILNGILIIKSPVVGAMTRQEYCQSLPAGPPAPGADGSDTAIGCQQELDRDTWNECITKPEAERGSCAEAYRNAEHTDKKTGGGETAPPPLTNDERKALADCDGSTDPEKCLKDNPLVRWTLFGINLLAAGVGVVVVIMIIIGGIQYASAGPNPQAVYAAKQKIANAVIALLAFFFLYAFLQYLIPGGVF